jgi:hypothetical protein
LVGRLLVVIKSLAAGHQNRRTDRSMVLIVQTSGSHVVMQESHEDIRRNRSFWHPFFIFILPLAARRTKTSSQMRARKVGGGAAPHVSKIRTRIPRKAPGGEPPRSILKMSMMRARENKILLLKKKSLLISEGTPDELLDNGADWPTGWLKRVYGRRKGTRKDKYWITPKQKYKLRSMVEVKQFMAALEASGGDEENAKQITKGSRK